MNAFDHSTRSAVLGLAAGLVIGAGAVAVATGALPVSHGVITECRTPSRNSLLRAGNPNGSCPKGQSAIRFNATGPRGSAGPQGPPGAAGSTGPAGPAGPSGIVDGISYSQGLTPCYSASALCSHGTVTPGGGYQPSWSVQLTTVAAAGQWSCTINSGTAADFSYSCYSADLSAAQPPAVLWWVKAG